MRVQQMVGLRLFGQSILRTANIGPNREHLRLPLVNTAQEEYVERHRTAIDLGSGCEASPPP